MKLAFASVFLLLVASTLSTPTQLTYKPNDFFSYSFSSQVQTGTQSANGALSTMKGTVEVQCQEINKAGNYLFAMNMFDVVVAAQNPPAELASNSRPLGDDMYFEQTPSGQVVNIWYQDGDAPYFVEIKTGAINSFHTSVIASGSTANVKESDVVGQHNSGYIANSNSDGSLALAKGFDQNDFTAFVDPHLSADNIVLKAQSSVSVHPAGYIQATSVSQLVSLSTISAPSTTDPDGWNSMLTAQGSLSLQVKPGSGAPRLSARVSSAQLSTPKFVAATLLSLGAHGSRYARSMAPSQHEIASTQDVLSVITTEFKGTKLRKVSTFFRAHPEAMTSFIEPLFALESLSKTGAQRLFALLASVNHKIADAMLINHGIKSADLTRQLAAMNTISVSQISGAEIKDALWSIVQADSALTATATRAALLAYGSILSRSSLSSRKIGVKKIQALLGSASASVHRVIHSAIRNSAPVSTFDAPLPSAGSMPFNKTWSASKEYGSSNTIGANFDANFFVGTNFNCNQDTFNYEALVISNASVNLWKYVQDVFAVRAVYGREGSQVLGNELYLQVFYKVIIDMQIPNQDCKSESYDVGSFTAPGVDVTYTVWVGCIPVVFTAGVNLEADLSYGWSICQNNLFAQVSAVPNVKLTASASAQTDLLIIEGDVQFDADFDVSIVPQAFVDGAHCSVGIDVALTADPMQASINAEYRKKKCEWWIFDCKWSEWTTDNLWSWNAPLDHESLYNQTWKIQ